MEYVFITGASSGIGNYLSKLLAKNGFFVFAVARTESKLQELKSLYPHNIEYIVSDVGTEEGRVHIIKNLPLNFKLKYLVHSAGVLDPVGRLKDLAYEDWRQNVGVNLEAPIFLTQKLLKFMSKGSRVLNISTGAAHKPIPGWTSYCVTKSASYMLYQCLKTDLAEQGILYGSMLPGIVDTPMQEKIRSLSVKDFSLVETFKGFKSENQLISPDVCAEYIKWVLTETGDNEYIEIEWDIYDKNYFSNWLSGSLPVR